MIHGDKNMLLFAIAFYNKRIGPITCMLNITPDVDMLVVLDGLGKILLDREFTVEEIRIVLFHLKHDKAPDPDRLPIKFYWKYQHII